jgi:ribosomal protein S6
VQTYEAMFLLDPARAAKDWTATENHVLDILKRHKAEIISSEKWADRKLAYPIKHQKRAVYQLVHFRAPGEAIARVRADCRLSETILRVLIIVDDPTMQMVPEAEMAAVTAATAAERRPPLVEETPPAAPREEMT